MRITFALNDEGRRVGESHPRAVLTDEQVESIRELHAGGFGYKRLGRIFSTRPDHIRDIVKCLTRYGTTMKHKTVDMGDNTVVRVLA